LVDATFELDICSGLAISPRVKFVRYRLIVAAAVALTLLITGNLGAAPRPAGTRFSARGKITLHRGEPCTPQIMFDFRPVDSKTVIWMAAGAHDSAKLTAAASDRRRVRISGTWRGGLHAGCGYVEVKTVVVETTWWSRLWKK
jgi:hypothetical protein